MMKTNNPVAKHSPTFNKPKVFRDRKKQAKKDGDYAEHPKHRPYHREQINWRHVVVDGRGDYDGD